MPPGCRALKDAPALTYATAPSPASPRRAPWDRGCSQLPREVAPGFSLCPGIWAVKPIRGPQAGWVGLLHHSPWPEVPPSMVAAWVSPGVCVELLSGSRFIKGPKMRAIRHIHGHPPRAPAAAPGQEGHCNACTSPPRCPASSTEPPWAAFSHGSPAALRKHRLTSACVQNSLLEALTAPVGL